MRNKSPAFQFYPDSWLSSPKIMLMTPAEEGAYIRLLSICWMNGHLPDDDDKLAELSRLKEGWFSGSSEKIRKCFTERGGKLYNERLSKERGKQLKWKQKSREGGIRSGKSRKKKALREIHDMKGSSRLVDDLDEPNANQKATLQSSSSSSTSTSNKEYMSIFDEARKLFKGTKRGLQTEYDYFVKTHADWKDVLPLLVPAVKQQIVWRAEDGRYWKNFKTWTYNRCWEESTGQTVPPEEKVAAEQKALERKRQEVRESYAPGLREMTVEKLQGLRKHKAHLTRWWLIDEILTEKGE